MIRLAVASLLLSLASAATVASAAEPDWAARYEVRFGVNDAGVPAARVAAELKWIGKPAERPKWVDVSLADDAFPKGYGAHVRSFEARVPEGAAAPDKKIASDVLDERTARRNLTVLGDGAIAFTYTVVLEHDAGSWGPGPDEAPYRFDGGAFWTGRALFLTAKNSRVEVAFAVPDGEKFATSFDPIDGRPGAFTAKDEARLRDAFFMVGRFADAELHVGDATVLVALGGALEPSLPLLSAAIGRFLEASGDLFGGAPRRRVLVCGNVGASPGSFHGGVFANDVSFLVDKPLGPENQSRWAPFLCHEIFHLWNPGSIDFEGQQYWFTEGFTDYYSRALLVRLGDMSAADFREDVRSRIARYLDASASRLSLLEAGEAKFDNTTIVYEGGSLAALCLDIEIRSATGNKRSLDDVMKALQREFSGLPLRRRPGTNDIARLASEAAGHSLGEFFARYVSGREPLPFADSFRRAGLSFSHEVADLPDLRSIARTLLQCPSMTEIHEGEGGVRVFSTLSPPFRENDVIVEVGGRAVHGFDDLRRAFQDRAPRSRVAVSVMRAPGKTPVALDVELGGDPGVPVPLVRFVKVTMEPLPDADVSALQIRKAIFGADAPRATTPQ